LLDYHDTSAVDLAQPRPGCISQGTPIVEGPVPLGLGKISGGAGPRSYLGAPRQADGPRPRREGVVVT
jgi:hypothetical protein